MSDVVDWLLEGDPSIRWQVERDLLDCPASIWLATQRTVGTEGWGTRLLAERDDAGLWAQGLYGPKWISTTYTLLQLWRMGLPRDNAEALESVRVLIDRPVWLFGRAHRQKWEGCVAGFGLALSSWFTIDDPIRDDLVEEILARQLGDGGWNCRADRGEQRHSSFHTTINTMEGLREYCLSGGKHTSDVEKAEALGRQFFAQHQMYRSHRTGRIPDPRMAQLHFPPRWHHDILRGLDYYRAAVAERDGQLADPIALLNGYRRKDGRWPLHQGYGGKVWFSMETGRNPSRWNTLRALRVLRWWNQTG